MNECIQGSFKAVVASHARSPDVDAGLGHINGVEVGQTNEVIQVQVCDKDICNGSDFIFFALSEHGVAVCDYTTSGIQNDCASACAHHNTG